MILIGLTGKSGSGKDTLANFIKHKHGSVNFAFADPVKAICKTMFLFNDEQLYGSQKNVVDPRWGITPRLAFQIIGTNMMQFSIYGMMPELIHQVPVRQFWVKHLEERIKPYKSTDTIVIVTDVRFQHEANLIRQYGGTIIRIDRPSLNTNSKMYLHSSEKDMDGILYDHVIINNGTLPELYHKGNQMLDKVRSKSTYG